MGNMWSVSVHISHAWQRDWLSTVIVVFVYLGVIKMASLLVCPESPSRDVGVEEAGDSVFNANVTVTRRKVRFHGIILENIN